MICPRSHKMAVVEKKIKSRFPQYNKANVYVLGCYLTNNKLRGKKRVDQNPFLYHILKITT